jgi:hypothetical protein
LTYEFAGPLSRNDQQRYLKCDTLLHTYLRAKDEEESKSLVVDLITSHAEPVIKNTIRSKLGLRSGSPAGPGRYPEDAEDLYSEVVLELLRRLRNLKLNQDAPAITDFRGYVRLLSCRACSGQARRMDPNRRSISDKVRYHLTVNPNFDLWLDDRDDWVCGLAKWRDEGRPLWKPAPSKAGRDVFDLFGEALRPGDEARMTDVKGLAAALFDWAGAPMELDDVIDVAGEAPGRPRHTRDVRRRGLHLY